MSADLTRRTALTAALAAAASLTATAPATARGRRMTYGSGTWGGLGTKRAYTPANIWQRVRDQDGVALFGDSITVATCYDTAVALAEADGSTLAVDGWNSRPTAHGVDAIEQAHATYGLPGRVVIALGTNDVFAPFGMDAQVDRAMACLGPDRQVWWVDTYVARPGLEVPDLRNSGIVNASIHAATGRHPNLRVISWARFLAGNPGYRIGTHVAADGVHTTAAGSLARAAVIAPAVAR